MARDNNLGVAEVIDTLSDAARLEMRVRGIFGTPGTAIEKALEMLPVVLTEYPNVREAVEDWETFKAELVNVFPIEAVAVYNAVKAALPAGDAEKSIIVWTVQLAAQGYVYADQALKNFEHLRGILRAFPA